MNLARVLVGGVAFVAACAEAGGEPTGGGITPAGTQAATPGEFTPPIADAGVDCGTGTTWHSLYTDIFGPTGKAGSCSFATSCHGTPDGDGAKSGAGIHCFDEAGCRQSMFDQNMVSAGNAPNPGQANLFGILRHRTATGRVAGIMPKEPTDYVFPDACLERVRGWIAAGAPAN